LSSGLSFVQSCTPLRRSSQSVVVIARFFLTNQGFFAIALPADPLFSLRRQPSPNRQILLQIKRTLPCQHPIMRFCFPLDASTQQLVSANESQSTCVSFRRSRALNHPAHRVLSPPKGSRNCARRNCLHLPGLFHPDTVLRVFAFRGHFTI